MLVLCYHAISERWPAAIAVTPDGLERQLSGFLDEGFRAATFTDAVSQPADGRTLAVTFDDAYRSVFELGYPVLRRLGIPATMFVPTAHVGEQTPRSWSNLSRWLGGPWEHELMGASWAQLGELAEAGWEIGSHTRSHPDLRALDDGALADELEGSRADCEDNLGRACRAIAYPYGDASKRVSRAASDAGYVAGALLSRYFSTQRAAPDPMCWQRLAVLRADGPWRLRVKRRLARHPRAWNLVQRARGVGREG